MIGAIATTRFLAPFTVEGWTNQDAFLTNTSRLRPKLNKLSVVPEDNNHVLVVQLKEFSLIDPVIKSVDVFQAIETVIPPETIEQTISTTQSKQERKRKLPSSLVVCLIIAMSLWSNDSMATVLKNLVQG